jgi:hypothetical protein
MSFQENFDKACCEKSFIKSTAKNTLQTKDKSYKDIKKSSYDLVRLNHKKVTIHNSKLGIQN